MAATEECAQRACFRMADVTVIHSVTTRATGLTATVMGRASRLAIVSWSVDAPLSSLPVADMATGRFCYAHVCDKGVKGVIMCRYGSGRMEQLRYMSSSMGLQDDTHPLNCSRLV
jgi:hypothetical protein